MTERNVGPSPVKWFGPIAAVVAVTNIAILFDIPVLRQISGFTFLTFIPGFLFLSILKLNKLGLTEKIVLSVGLSVAFSMLFGIALNGSLLAFGYTQPLSTTPILISFSTATIVMAIIAYMRNRGITFSFTSLRLTTQEKALLVVPSLSPLLSIFGMRIMNLTDNNSALMLMLIAIAAYVIFISFFHRQTSGRIYPIAIFLISISLLLMYSLRSNHIIGSDIHRTYFMFLTTVDNLKWSQLGFGVLDSALSISLLPAVYQAFLNIGSEYLFKILYAVLVSTLPLVVYSIARKYVGDFYAFLASIFFMSQITFLWTLSYARINIAILFFALAIMAMFLDTATRLGRTLLVIIFTAAIIVSHYGVAYATFFILILTWLVTQVLQRVILRKRKPDATSTTNSAVEQARQSLSPQEQPRTKRITITLITLFITILFFWYSEVTGPTFSAGVRFVSDTFANWQWLLGGDAVGGYTVQSAMGRTLPSAALPQRIEFVFSWLTIVLMSIGLLITIVKLRTRAAISYAKHGKPGYLLENLSAEYIALSIACYILVVATVLLPYVSEAYGAARTYMQMMVPLSVFFAIGGIEVARYFKLRPHLLLVAVLVPYFLCTTGFMCQIFGSPRAITLNSQGELYSSMYISDAESNSAQWLKEYNREGTTIYAQSLGKDMLLSQGRIPYEQTNPRLISRHEEGKSIDGYIYLRRKDIIDDKLVTEYPCMFTGRSKIYANGNSEVYR